MRTARLQPYSSVILLAGLVANVGCSAAQGTEVTGSGSQPLLTAQQSNGQNLFHQQEFGGNGRTCSTCHTDANNFTLSPAQVQEAFGENPPNPIFRSIDSDDGVGNSYTRLLTYATIRISINLPSGTVLADNPSQTSVVFDRGIPTTNNTPDLDPILMSDGRAPNVPAQADGAINAHMQPTVQPTQDQLNAIAAYEDTLFSSAAVAAYAQGQPLPLPTGNTDSEKRGAKFFLGSAPQGICTHCHGGPLLDEDNVSGTPGFDFIFAGELPSDNQLNQLRSYVIDMTPDIGKNCDPKQCKFLAGPGGGGNCVNSPAKGCELAYRDPGRALIDGHSFDIGGFKVPILRGIAGTAPYFHDNSAATLTDVVNHYVALFNSPFNLVPLVPAPGGFTAPTAADVPDIVAYMQLL